MACILDWIWKGWLEDTVAEEFRPFKMCQIELLGLKGCLLWEDRVIILKILQKDILEILHEGHPGIVKMKALARSYV